MDLSHPGTFRVLGGRALLAALVGFVLVYLPVPSGIVPAAQSQDLRASGEGQSGSGSTPAGQRVVATYSSTPPMRTLQQVRELEAKLDRSNRPGPFMLAVPAPTTAPLGPGQPAAKAHAVQMEGPDQDSLIRGAGTFSIFRNTVIPASGIDGGYGSVSGRAHEPSTGANGKNVFQTGNWYGSRSFDNGATWGFLDPYTIFGSDLGGFCCDQVTLYDSGRDAQWWLLQFSSGLKLASSRGADLFTNWCYYNIDATWFGQPATTEIDYNEMVVGRRFIYITSNLFPASGGAGAGILRLPIDALRTCGGFGYSSIAWMPPDWSFSWVPVQGADQGTMYWGSNWNSDLTSGSQYRLWSWEESSGGYSWYDRDIDAFAFMFRNGGQFCGSATGNVKNWCEFNDSRVKSGALAKGVIQFTFDAMQDGGHPFPFSRRIYISESDKAYLGFDEAWASWGAFQYWEIAPNTRGDIGMTVAWGGGTGLTDYYPSGGVLIQDDYAPSQPWQRVDVVFGAGNPCQRGTGLLYSWGDYLTVRAYDPERLVWVATNFAIEGNNCGSAGWFSEPHNIVFGRKRDLFSYRRWRYL